MIAPKLTAALETFNSPLHAAIAGVKPMVVRAKFVVASTKEMANPGQPDVVATEVVMQAANGPENDSWSKYTPSGTLTMVINASPDAQKAFVPGKYVLIEFAPQP